VVVVVVGALTAGLGRQQAGTNHFGRCVALGAVFCCVPTSGKKRRGREVERGRKGREGEEQGEQPENTGREVERRRRRRRGSREKAKRRNQISEVNREISLAEEGGG